LGKRKRMRLVCVALAVALVGGCGGGDEGGGGTNALEVTRPDGSRVEFPDELNVWCGEPFDDRDPSDSMRSLNIVVGEIPLEDDANPTSYWTLTRRISAIEAGRKVTPGEDEHGFSVFVFDGARRNELTTDLIEAETPGSEVVVEEISCRPGGRVRVSIDLTLASEVGQGTVEARGTIDTTIGEPLPQPE
jgi:hypothetical protein